MSSSIAGGKIERGDVLVSLNHEFDDGRTAPKKYLVAFGCRNGNFLYFLATSQMKFGRVAQEGCRHEHVKYNSCFHILPPKKKTGKFKDSSRLGFIVPTWVVLDPQYCAETVIAARMAASKVYREFSLAQHEFAALKACFLSAPESAPIHREF